MKCVAKVAAGVCSFTTEITADSPDDQMLTLSLATDCQKIAGLAQALEGREIDGYDEIGAVLSGIFKAVQVAARVALPRDISITMSAG